MRRIQIHPHPTRDDLGLCYKEHPSSHGKAMQKHNIAESSIDVQSNLHDTEDRQDGGISAEYLYARHPGFDEFNTIPPAENVDTLM